MHIEHPRSIHSFFLSVKFSDFFSVFSSLNIRDNFVCSGSLHLFGEIVNWFVTGLSNERGLSGIFDSLKGLVFLTVEVGVLLLSTPEHEDGDDEKEEANEGDNESHDLPEGVVRPIAAQSAGIDGEIGTEVPHHELPEGPRDEVLD